MFLNGVNRIVHHLLKFLLVKSLFLVLVKKLLHYYFSVLKLKLVLFAYSFELSILCFKNLVLIEKSLGLRLEVIQLIVKRIYLVLLVFLLNHWIKLFYDFLSLFSHLLNLFLDNWYNLVLVTLDSPSDVIIH